MREPAGAPAPTPGAAGTASPPTAGVATEPVSGQTVAPGPATRLPATTVCVPQPGGREVCQVAGAVAASMLLVAVDPGLGLLPAADGTVWLLPTYRFTTSTGAGLQVLAVDTTGLLKVPQAAPAGG